MSELPAGHDELTPREHDVQQLVAAGLTNLEIPNQLGLSPDTAKTPVSRILTNSARATASNSSSWPIKRESRTRIRVARARPIYLNANWISPQRTRAGTLRGTRGLSDAQEDTPRIQGANGLATEPNRGDAEYRSR
jgi:hypothetical protein